MNQFLTINPENKSGKIKLNDIVMQPVMDKLIGEIGKIFGAKAMANGADFGELMNYAENAVDTLEIEIHSPGGSVLDGYTLYNEIMALRSRGVHVTATISLAASMASVIAMAADVVRIYPTGRMMIHEVSQGIRGSAEELRKAADLCEQMSNEIAEIYAGKTGKPVDEMRQMMKVETWLSAKEAVAQGFANEVFDIRPAKTKPDAMNILKVLFPGNAAEISEVEAALADMDSLRNDVAMMTEEVATLKAELSEKHQEIAEQIALTMAREETIIALNAEKETLTASITAKDGEIQNLKDEVETAKASAGKLATEQLAAIGQPEALDIEEQSITESKSLTRAQFNALSPAEKSKFSIAGGKIKG